VKIPAALGRLSAFTSLTLSGNGLVLPEDLSGLRALRRLELDIFGLRPLPAWVCRLPALEELEVRSHVLSTLPDELAAMRTLRRLRLAPFEAPSPPRVLHRMTSLETLSIWSAVRYCQADIDALARALPSTTLAITYTVNVRDPD
jgi:Leucine-rich repeat (LRR) protein